MKKKELPKFYALHKDFNNGEVRPYEVLGFVFREILNDKGGINKRRFYLVDKNYERVPVTTKEQCAKFVNDTLRYYFWGNATWEYVAIDWPYRETIKDSRPVKIDVYEQLEPNLPIIVDLVWNYLEPKVAKLK